MLIGDLQVSKASDKKILLKHTGSQNITITIEKLASGKNKVCVTHKNTSTKRFIPYKSWVTSYSIDLIQKILEIKGPAYLCDEIMRDESPDYLQKSLQYSLLSYEKKESFANKTILDFGCGSGSSSLIIARMLPNVKIIGIDLDKRSLELAKLRAKHYNLTNIQFLHSKDPQSLPNKTQLGNFDYIILSAVYEHLKPQERKNLLPQLWDILSPGGILFINRTPYRYFPLEIHTTGGLPLINYFPNRLTQWCAQKFSKKNLQHDSWDTLLKKGIRGGNPGEILRILRNTHTQSHNPTTAKTITLENWPVLLKPTNLGIKDRVDLWYHETNTKRYSFIKKSLFLSFKLLKKITGSTLAPTLSLAIKKDKKRA